MNGAHGFGGGTLVRAATLAVSCWLMAPEPLAAQWDAGPSVLTLLPVTGTVEVGATVEGALEASDYVAVGRRVKAYRLEGNAGAPVTIDLISDDFDSYLHLVGPDGTEIETDDDSGGACHARISTFLPSEGEYRIVASSLSGGTGAFTLRLDERQQPPAPGDCGGGAYESDVLSMLSAIEPGGTLGPGDAAEGSLGPGDAEIADGSRADAYDVSGEAGRTVYVDLVSRDFDALLFVITPDGSEYDSDDDSGGACNSRMEVTLEARPHRVIVNSLSAEGSGAYTVRVSETEGPQATGPCPGLGPDIRR